MRRVLTTTLTIAVLVLAGCASESQPNQETDAGGPPSASEGSTTATGNGALIVSPLQGTGAGAQRYPINVDGTIGPASAVPWETGPDAEATRLNDALGPWVLTATVELPLTDVSRTTQLQVRAVDTGQVVHQLDVPGWCSGPDGASYPCLLLDETRMVRTTPIDTLGAGTITISSIETGQTIAEYGPFPALGDVLPTNSPDSLIVVTFDDHGQRVLQRLDTGTGSTQTIGTLPGGQPVICALGTDSILTYTTTLQAIGPAAVAPVKVPELGTRGPGAYGCSADGAHLYVQAGLEPDPSQGVVIDSVNLADGTRTTALTLEPAQIIRVTR